MGGEANSILEGIEMSRRTFTKLTAFGTAVALSGISSISALPEIPLIEPASAAPQADEEKLV
ncbi:MAG: hypothetical protein EFT35_01765, partial [Methanophagales archaeon ANME-1-THS]